MPKPSKMMEGTSVRSNSEGLPLTQMSPHITSISPMQITSETHQISIMGFSLNGQLKVILIGETNDRPIEIEVNSSSNNDIKLENLNLTPGKYNLQVEHTGGKSNLFPIEIQATKQPQSSVPVGLTPSDPEQSTKEIEPKSKAKKEGKKLSASWGAETKSARLTLANWKRLSIEAAKTNSRKNDLINSILEDYFNNKGNKI